MTLKKPNVQGEKTAKHVVAVSLHKSGTNLLAKLLENLGYKCIGHGIRDSYQEVWSFLSKSSSRSEDPRNGFFKSDRMLDLLSKYPDYTCLFLHHLDISLHLESWCHSGLPKILFNYRDPRSTLLSLINYFLKKTKGGYTELPWNVINARILESLPNMDKRLMYAINFLPEHTELFRTHAWMLFHPDICNVSYEDLVGQEGGGSKEEQKRIIQKVMFFLEAKGELEWIANSLYDKFSRTFYQGKIDSWRYEFKNEHLRLFDFKYGDLLDAYGYPRSEVFSK